MNPTVTAPRALHQLAERWAEKLTAYNAAQCPPRQSFVCDLVLQPLDLRRKPCGEPFAAVTRDVSSCGVGVIHAAPSSGDLWEIEVAAASEEERLIIQPLQTRGLGLYFDTGCCFVGESISHHRLNLARRVDAAFHENQARRNRLFRYHLAVVKSVAQTNQRLQRESTAITRTTQRLRRK